MRKIVGLFFILILTISCSQYYYTLNEIPKKNISYGLDEFDIYVFTMQEIKKEIPDRKNHYISRYVNGIDEQGKTNVEELYLLINKSKGQSFFLTTLMNKYVTTNDLSTFSKKGYESSLFLNTPLHKDYIIVQELQFAFPMKINGNKFIIKHSNLDSPNIPDDLIIQYQEYDAGTPIVEFISVNDNRPFWKFGKKNKRSYLKDNPRIVIDTTFEMKMKFKYTNRKLAFVKYFTNFGQDIDSIHIADNKVYFSRPNKKNFVDKNNIESRYIAKELILNKK